MNNEEVKLVADFAEGFAGLGLKYFKASEFLFRGGSNGFGACKGKNTLPPRSTWANIYKVAKVLESIRQRAGAPVTLLSIYRSPDYNACVGGVGDSQHTLGTACDFQSSIGARLLYDIAIELRRAGAFAGGIGYYEKSNFVHVDVRGHNATWRG